MFGPRITRLKQEGWECEKEVEDIGKRQKGAGQFGQEKSVWSSLMHTSICSLE